MAIIRDIACGCEWRGETSRGGLKGVPPASGRVHLSPRVQRRRPRAEPTLGTMPEPPTAPYTTMKDILYQKRLVNVLQ